jgi:cytidylate kinase
MEVWLMNAIKVDRQTLALERALLYPDHHDEPAPATPGLTIALSRQVGTPVDDEAAELGQRLGWAVHNADILERIARELGISTAALAKFDERRRSWLVECLESFSVGAGIGESVYVRRLVRTLRELAAKGDCVIIGRGAAHLLPAETTLTVRLIGEREDRITMLAHRLGIDRAQAARTIDEVESERARFIKEYFNHDPRDMAHYDLVLNTSHLSIAQCAGLIVEAVHQREEMKRPL